MDIVLRVEEWLTTLGYDGDIPDAIRNPSTAFLWDQLIQNVRPRMEVQNIRNNILVNYLNNNGISLNNTDSTQCNLEEVNLYLKKKGLENDLANISNSISEKKSINTRLVQQNKIKRFSIERSKLKIKENEEKEYLLRQKRKLLEKDIQNAEKIYNSINQNMIINDESVNSTNITEILQQCENKLEENVQKIPPPTKQCTNETINKLMFTAQKTAKKTNMFEKYLCLTEKKTSKKIRKYVRSKETPLPNKINIRLFANEDNMQITNKKNMSDRRESLEMFMEDNDDENFLVKLNEPNIVSPINTLADEITSDNTKCDFIQQTNINIEAAFDESVIRDINDLINKYNRQRIHNMFLVLDDNLHFNLSKKINFRNTHFTNNKNRRQADLALLQSLHVRTEFKIIKNNLMIKSLTRRYNDMIAKMNESISNSEYPFKLIESLKINLQLQMEDVGLECLLDVMKKEICNSEDKSRMNNIFELQKNLTYVKDKIALKRNSLVQYVELIQEIFVAVNRMRNTTSSCVRKLAAFMDDKNWCSPLPMNLYYQELKAFEELSLEHNRKCINTDPSLYYRDIHTNKFLSNREINDDNINKLSVILNTPFTMPETIILNILRTKIMLNAMKAIKPVENKAQYNEYSLKYLQDKETYIVTSTEKLNSLIASSTSKKTLSASVISQKVMDLWVEMPFTKYISPSRIFDNKDYKTYEREFDSFYNNL